MGPKSRAGVLIRDRRGEDIDTEEKAVKTEAEIGMMWLHIKEQLEPPETKEAKDRVFCRVPRGSKVLPDLGLPSFRTGLRPMCCREADISLHFLTAGTTMWTLLMYLFVSHMSPLLKL